MISWHWIPFVVNLVWIFGFFARNMINKDRSMAGSRLLQSRPAVVIHPKHHP